MKKDPRSRARKIQQRQLLRSLRIRAKLIEIVEAETKSFGVCQLTDTSLAEVLGLGERQTRKHIAYLVASGILVSAVFRFCEFGNPRCVRTLSLR